MAAGGKSLGQLISLLCNEATAADSIVRLIEQQPLLAARILRVANSAYYGYNRSVTTIPRAVSILGTGAIRAIAVTCCFDRVMLQRLENTLQDSPNFLRHSIATAIAAQALATVARLPNHQEAYVAGMLHNVGVAIQACVDATGIRKLERARQSGITAQIRALESTHCRTTHEMCGGLVLDAWQLPPALVSVAAHHHEPTEAPPGERPLVALINIATTLATSCNCGFVLESSLAAYQPETLRCAQIDQADVDEVAAVLSDRVATFWEALSLM
jgi:HD-like signal output (HDOD) protein